MPTLTREQVRQIDRRAIEEFALPGIVLMENAGRGAAELLHREVIDGPVVICCGKGNNGGDGFVIARHLQLFGHEVHILLFADPASLEGDALTNYRVASAARIPLTIVDEPGTSSVTQRLASAAWIVDALLGTGVTGSVREPFLTAIEQINQASRPTLAVDVPSGLDCDTGWPAGTCVRATLTATFVAMKTGFTEPHAQEFTGPVHVVSIGVPRCLLEELGLS